MVEILIISIKNFILVYPIVFLIILITTRLSWLILILPFVLYTIFFLTSTVLLQLKIINTINLDKKLQIVYLRLFILHKEDAPINTISYSYKNEFTSKLNRAMILRIYFSDVEVFNRYHSMDGMTDEDALCIVEKFKIIGIKEV